MFQPVECIHRLQTNWMLQFSAKFCRIR